MIRKFTVIPVLNGYVVEIGCQTAVFTSVNDLTNAIGTYLRSPKETEEKWRATALNSAYFSPHDNEATPAPPQDTNICPPSYMHHTPR